MCNTRSPCYGSEYPDPCTLRGVIRGLRHHGLTRPFSAYEQGTRAGTAMIPHAPTAWHLLSDRTQLRPAEPVLLLAAGGALGTAGLPVATRAGARGIAAAGADGKGQKACDLGADEVGNARTTKRSKAVMRLTDGQGGDVVCAHLPDLVLIASPGAQSDATHQGGTIICLRESKV